MPVQSFDRHRMDSSRFQSGLLFFMLCSLVVADPRLLLRRLNHRQCHTRRLGEQADASVHEIDLESMRVAVYPSHRHNDLACAQAIHDRPLRIGLRHISQQPQGFRGIDAACHGREPLINPIVSRALPRGAVANRAEQEVGCQVPRFVIGNDMKLALIELH